MTKVRIEDIVEKVLTFHPDADTSLIHSAYIFSAKCHKGQTRYSGEPYLEHPLHVSNILADMRLDATCVATGLLHDTVEDTIANVEELSNLFGPEVASLVDGLTKIGKLVYNTREERQAENFRKMIVFAADDVRVTLIKLADRLHNMRTLEYQKPERITRIAQETLDIYAQLANRLGIGWIKSELEDLSFKYLKPNAYTELELSIKESAMVQSTAINETTELLQKMVDEAGIKGSVVGRLKHLYSIYQKLQRQRITVDQVFDLIGFRIMVDTTPECYSVLGLIHNRWRPIPGRFKDFIGSPKMNDYQSLHTTVIGPYNERIEIQIRTREMNYTAEEGVAAHWRYKEKSGEDIRDLKKFDWMRKLVELQQDVTDSQEFLESLRDDLKSDEIFVFTPQGEIKQFPPGATPLDFAFSIHTDIGMHCSGAKVNGRIVPLSYRMKTGDSVHILTHPSASPSKDWLNFAATSRARHKVRAHVNKEMVERSVSLGRDMLEKGLRKYQLNFNKLLKAGEVKKAAGKLGYKDTEKLFMAISAGKTELSDVASALNPKISTPQSRVVKKEKHRDKSKTAVVVQGISDLMVRYASCCSPVRGDEIVGYMTRGRGMTIHRTDCSILFDLDKERLIEADWDEALGGQLTARVRVVSENMPGMLADISREISMVGANIDEVSFRRGKDNQSQGAITVTVDDNNQLLRMLENLRKIDGVISAERVNR